MLAIGITTILSDRDRAIALIVLGSLCKLPTWQPEIFPPSSQHCPLLPSQVSSPVPMPLTCSLVLAVAGGATNTAPFPPMTLNPLGTLGGSWRPFPGHLSPPPLPRG